MKQNRKLMVSGLIPGANQAKRRVINRMHVGKFIFLVGRKGDEA
jgi:hypothetical protein